MEFSDVVRARRMVRTYDPNRAVTAHTIHNLLDLAIRAPSAGFSQGWDFVVLHTAEQRERFWAATTTSSEPDRWLQGMMTAPALILCLSDPEHYLDRYAEPDKGWDDRAHDHWPIPYWDVDTGMAALLILLGAVDSGLGGCFFGVPGEQQATVKESFGIPADRRIVGVVSLGYPAPDRRSPSLKRGRRPITEVAHDGHFGAAY